MSPSAVGESVKDSVCVHVGYLIYNHVVVGLHRLTTRTSASLASSVVPDVGPRRGGRAMDPGGPAEPRAAESDLPRWQRGQAEGVPLRRTAGRGSPPCARESSLAPADRERCRS